MLLQNNTVTKKKQLDSTYAVLITFYKAIMYCFYISESILDTFVYSNLQDVFDHRALSTKFDFTRLTELLLFCNIFKPNQPFIFVLQIRHVGIIILLIRATFPWYSVLKPFLKLLLRYKINL